MRYFVCGAVGISIGIAGKLSDWHLGTIAMVSGLAGFVIVYAAEQLK